MPTTNGRPPRRARRARGLSLVALIVLTAGSAACGSGPDATLATAGKIELTVAWWGGPERADLTNKALDLYTRRHPNVTFRRTSDAWKDYYANLEVKMAGGASFDILQIDDNALTEYSSRNITLDLSRFIAAHVIDERRFPESLAGCGEINGTAYAVASAENTPAMVYDWTAVQAYGLSEPQIGWSYDQLIAWAGEFTARSGGVAGTMDASGAYHALWLWLRAQGKELYNGNELGFTAADLQRWFELWATARQRRVTPSAEVVHAANSGDVTKQPVATGQAGTSFVWSNQLAELQKGTDHQLRITAYPGDPRGQWARASMFWSIQQGSKHPDAAADVINFLVNDPDAGRILGTERGLPANLDVRGQLSAALPPAMQATVAFENAMVDRFGPAPAPPPKGHGEAKTLLVLAAENVMYGRATPQQSAEQFVVQARQALSG